jgi:hypothetical protein
MEVHPHTQAGELSESGQGRPRRSDPGPIAPSTRQAESTGSLAAVQLL